jgi:hypothetical protein
MPFHVLNSKKYGRLYFINNEITASPESADLDLTWSYSSEFNHVEFLELWLQGKQLQDCVSPDILEEFTEATAQLKTYLKTFKHSQLSISISEVFDYVPMSFLRKYFGVRNKMLLAAKNQIIKPSTYDFYLSIAQLLADIEQHKLNVPDGWNNTIRYNLFGSSTGRLTTPKKSFPILCLNKKLRHIVKPQNDFLIEMDYNAVEPRVYLGLMRMSQPSINIHSWHQDLYRQSFGEDISRDDMKEKFFAWFYGYKNEPFGIPEIDKIYNKEPILDKYWNNGTIHTIYDKQFSAPHERAFNNIIQSTAALLFLEQAVLVRNYLNQNDATSFIKLLIHDSLVLDFSKKDKKLYRGLCDIFKKTRFGEFMVNIKVGGNFGDMKEI